MKKSIHIAFIAMTLCSGFAGCSKDDKYIDSKGPQSIYVSNIENNTVAVHTTETVQLSVDVLPNDAELTTPVTYTYTSADEHVFTVSPTGLVTGINVGEAILNITSNYEDLSAKVMVSVTDRLYPVTGIQLGETYENGVMPLNSVLDLKSYITVLPENASNPKVAFSSSKNEVISVTDDGIITALSTGEAIITISATDGADVSTTLTLTVKETLYTHTLERTGWSVIATSHQLPEDSGFKNEPTSLFDDSTTTGLSMVKPGKSYGGISVGADEEAFFVFDMTAEASFNFMTMTHRSNNTTLGLRPNEFSVYGSNDNKTFIPIREKIAGNPEAASYHVDFTSIVQYRYIKVRYTEWGSSGSTIQLSEINLGTRIF